MSDLHLDAESKARLFDQLMRGDHLLAEALRRLAEEKARAFMTIHKSGLRPTGRAFTPADFGLQEISGLYEIVTGSPLALDQLIEAQRLQVESLIADPGFDGVRDAD